MIHPNHKKHNGPTHGPIRKSPLVYKASGGNPGGQIPSNGYFTSSINFTQNIDPDANQAEILAGTEYILGSAFPAINNSNLPSDGHNPYEPVKIPFIHKFGGPHCSNLGFGTLDSQYTQEEFLRIKLHKDTDRNVFCPYTAATLTAAIFPYGQTNKGIVSAPGNRTGVSVFRYKFPLNVNKPNFDSDGDLFNLIGTGLPPGHFAPLYSSSIVNFFSAKEDYTEFQVNTNPGAVDSSYIEGKHCVKDGDYIDMLSLHPEISEGVLDNFNLPGEIFPYGEYDPLLGGANILQDTTNSNIQYKCQGKTDGDDLSFFLNAQKGSVIKGLIELF